MNPSRSSFVALAGFGTTLSLAILTYRHGRVLTFDGYHYCELAKRFATEWPDRFGNHWPFGYPLLGGLLGRLGLPAHEALVVWSAVALVVLMLGAQQVLRNVPHRWLPVCALAAAPALVVQFFGNLTELPFAAALLGLALSLARWPGRRALWTSAVLAVLALGLRYAGIIALPALAVWLVAGWGRLRSAGRAVEAVSAVAAAAAASGGLLWWNIAVSGHASGAGRGAAAGLINLPHELAMFGWSAPSAVLAGGVRRVVDPASPPGFVLGGVIFAGLAAISAAAWLRPASTYSRPLALVGLGYAGGMAVLHCVGDFDALYNARTFVPALFPFGLLLAEWARERPRLILTAGLTLLAAGLLAAGRGLSREVAGDVRPALTTVHSLLAPGTTLGLNDHAFSLGAYFPNPTRRVWPANLVAGEHPDIVVVAAEPVDRDGNSSRFDPAWREALQQAGVAPRLRLVFESPEVMVFARSPLPPGARP